MKLRRFAACFLLMIFLAVCLLSCGSPEERKTKFFNTGENLYKKGDYTRAIINFQNAAKIDPNFALAHQMIGLSLLRQNRPQPAYASLNRAVELKPDLWDAQAALGRLLLLSGRKKEAREKIDLILAKVPDHEEALLLKAIYLLSEQKTPEAEQILRNLIARKPQREEPYLLLATLKSKQNMPAESKAILKNLLARNPRSGNGRLMLIQILEKQQQLPEAEAEYKALIAQNPSADGPKLLLAGFYQRTGRSSVAEAILLELVKSHPDKVNARLQLARFYAVDKKPDAMITVLKKAIVDFPKELAPYDLLARYYLAVKNSKQAIAILEQYLGKSEGGPDSLKAKVLLSGILYYTGNKDRSLKLVEEVIKENPRDLAAHALKGDLMADRKDYATAVSEYRVVIKESPRHIPTLFRLSRAHQLNGEVKLAEETYRTILGLQPKSPAALLGFAGILESKAETAKARAIHEDIISRYPNSLVAANNLAFHLAEYEPNPVNLDRAEKLLMPFMKPNGNIPHLVDTAAWVAYRQGRYGQAKDLLARLDASSLRIPAISYHMGMICLRLGDQSSARYYLDVAVRAPESFPGSTEAKNEFKKLKI